MYTYAYAQVLDHNIEFSQTKGLLPFLLKLLGYSAAPNQNDFPHLLLDDRQVTRESAWKECGYNLGFLQPKIQAPWLRVFFVILYKVNLWFAVSLMHNSMLI